MIFAKLAVTRLVAKALLFSVSAILAVQAKAASEIVIAIRYLQAEGTSHAHLYLYREDGKLLRQLTNQNSEQDSDPIFSPDGGVIVFAREKPKAAREFWSESSPYFTNIEPEEPTSASGTSTPAESGSPTATPAPTYKSPDGSVELILREDPKDENDQIDGPGHGKHYVLRDLKTGTETEFGKIPGFEGAFEILHDRQDKNRHFLFESALRLAFFGLHLNSTDGDTVFALDLNGPRFVNLSPNWATPIPLPNEAVFLTLTENRYVPIPGSSKTANCWYIERWDDKLTHIRYAREKSAALCYGMSMYRPGKDPRVITLRRSSE